MSPEQSSDQDKLSLTTQQKIGILCSFAKDKVVEQIQCVWFIILYLVVFQLLVLGLPIVYSLMIAVGIGIVIIGLAFFMEGLRLGLMPLGETLGSTLPRKKIFGIPCLPASLAFGFVLGAFATFAEPAIGVLRAAGAGVDPTLAPLLWTILNTGATNLVNSVGAGVGIAVLLGVLRFYKGWSLKPFIYVGVIVLSSFTLYFQFSDARLQHVLGLAWDCGAVTTGPVTVPLVLALGIGVCRIVSTGGPAIRVSALLLLHLSFLSLQSSAMPPSYSKPRIITSLLFQKQIGTRLPLKKRSRKVMNDMASNTTLTYKDSVTSSQKED